MGATTKLPLTKEEKSLLRKSKVKVSDIHHFTTEQLASMLTIPLTRAAALKG
ncbi:hypothetical protein [Halobacillus halophilus]|uniref:hypothetical protein n=1 Tax=Halobacillus halophilus TaxID=1570 RepID=UPI001CD4C584|nr:hypothetical protein [Halobacillus halophilus]MCA1010594.1 hypothetical protein [Halobacillus halophilus]